MDRGEIWRIAMEQSALELGCAAEDFLREENAVVPLGLGPGSRSYYEQPIGCTLVSYGNNIVAGTEEGCRRAVEEYLSRYEFYHCFETPNLHWLDGRLRAGVLYGGVLPARFGEAAPPGLRL